LSDKLLKTLFSESHEATLELARSPVLLGYLCVAYQGTLSLSSNRAQVYRRALDIYLQEWNAHGLKTQHSEQVHDLLPHETELDMLAQIAFDAFRQEKFFLTQDEWLSGIRGFMAELVEKPKALNAEAILRKIAVSQVLVVQRTHSHWSFNHLTLQEYLVALHVDRNDLATECIQKHLGEKRWNEVFQILASIRPAGRQLKLMAETANKRIRRCERSWSKWLKFFQNWTNASIDQTTIHREIQLGWKLAAIAIACTIEDVGLFDKNLDLRRSEELQLIAARALQLVKLLDGSLGCRLSAEADEVSVHVASPYFLTGQYPDGVLSICAELLEKADLRQNSQMEEDMLKLQNWAAISIARPILSAGPIKRIIDSGFHDAFPQIKNIEALLTYLESIDLILKCRKASPVLKDREWHPVVDALVS
jgi:hypothetical protein